MTLYLRMRVLLFMSAIACASVPRHSARAARDTDIPAFLHGEAGVAFEGSSLWGRLTEKSTPVGEVQEGDNVVRFDLRFGVLPTLELFGSIPYMMNGYRRYSDVASMCGDEENLPSGTMVPPNDGSDPPQVECTSGSTVYYDVEEGAYQANPAASRVPEYAFSGMGNVVVGFRYSPFHERSLGTIETLRERPPALIPPLVTWRLELGIVFRTGESRLEGGAASGASGFRLGTSFSKRIGVADPYLSVRHTRYASFEMEALSDDGSVTTVEVHPANLTEVFWGSELIPYEDDRRGARFAVDFAGGADIRWVDDVISGWLLPSVTTLDEGGTAGELVWEEERLTIKGRIRLHYQIFSLMRLQAEASAGYALPHRLESPYSVMLSRTIRTTFGVQLGMAF